MLTTHCRKKNKASYKGMDIYIISLMYIYSSWLHVQNYLKEMSSKISTVLITM